MRVEHCSTTDITWKAEKQLGEPARLVLVSGPGVLLQGGVHPLPQLLHPVDVLESLHVRVEENDGTQTAQLGFVQGHLLHLGDELYEDSVEDPAHSAGVSVLSRDHHTIGKQNSCRSRLVSISLLEENKVRNVHLANASPLILLRHS